MLQKLILLSRSFKNQEEAKEEEFCYKEKEQVVYFLVKSGLGVHFLLNCVDDKQKNSLFFARMACVGFG